MRANNAQQKASECTFPDDEPRWSGTRSFPSALGLRLAIGPLVIALEIDEVAVYEQVKAHYASWRTDQSPHAHLRVALSRGQRCVDLSRVHPQWRESRFLWQTDSCELAVSTGTAEAVLVGSSSCPLAEVEYALRVLVALSGHRVGVLLLHSSGLVVGGRAVLFLGPSGAGKSTTARNGRRWGTLLADDLVGLTVRDGAWWAFTTPFGAVSQSPPESNPQAVPLALLSSLVHEDKVRVVPLFGAEALAACLQAVPLAALSPSLAPWVIARLHDLVQRVPVVQLHLRPDDSYWPALEPYLEQWDRRTP